MTGLRIVGMVLAAAFVISCGGSSGSGGSGGSGVTLPSGFPSDFPTYSGASVSTASSPKTGEFDVAWTTSDKAGKLFAYYHTQLATGDWSVQGIAGDATSGGLIDFNRKSSSGFGGTIKLADGRIHVIMGTGCPCEAPS
jgi:hypothetical protein